MLTSLALLLAVPAGAQTPAQTPTPNLARFVYPLAPSLACPPVEIDVTDSPGSKVWAEQAAALVREWYGPLTQMMATDGRHPITGQPTGRKFEPPARITLVFKKTLNVPAYCSGGTITINGEWIAQRPDDLGMVIHELSHAIQQYPRNEIDAGWLTEGISDYIRWWRYEPQLHATRGRTVPDFSRAKYTDAYRTTAVWLAFIEQKYDRRLVPTLDYQMRLGKDPMPVFKELTGKTADELWEEFKAEFK